MSYNFRSFKGSKGAQNGNKRRTMAIGGRIYSESDKRDPTRPPAKKSSGCSQRHSLDYANWRTMGRYAAQISSIPNLPPLVPEVGQGWGHGHDFEGLGGGSKATRENRPHGMFHRRHLRGGKKGGPDIGLTKCGKGTKIMAVADRHGLPIALHIAGANFHESKLVERTLDNRFVRAATGRLVGDKAYDNDGLDRRLRKRGVRLISPHRMNRKKPKTQDGRELRRYARRWKIERFFAWLKSFRRLCNRWEHKSTNFAGFVKLATIMILARNYF